ncbi:hypothetical protein POSPLADRAFT_1050695 [Postia placenta MAD-698-R-SB12]|uniref:Uncharacterized protein n=1 Tax=Postia placenta MAD-698-R-SB12 TaxID=670580 RepID=A0A1X6MJH0_9APHY|nr:hypothetical protein POSPLADRAFT_1050695 [Postia placenta MAD-698-R-SB12]OSX56495.1 hypothetical protein POSPLADRAFT_1050695 [Postia placenta MAD-698-R-SB12]
MSEIESKLYASVENTAQVGLTQLLLDSPQDTCVLYACISLVPTEVDGLPQLILSALTFFLAVVHSKSMLLCGRCSAYPRREWRKIKPCDTNGTFWAGAYRDEYAGATWHRMLETRKSTGERRVFSAWFTGLSLCAVVLRDVAAQRMDGPDSRPSSLASSGTCAGSTWLSSVGFFDDVVNDEGEPQVDALAGRIENDEGHTWEEHGGELARDAVAHDDVPVAEQQLNV